MTTVNLSEDLREEMEELLGQLESSLTTVIRETDTRIALPPDARSALAGLGEPLPESGCGAMAAMERLLDLSAAAGGNTAGPKCFHFVIGGSTPAALAADLLATAYDALTYTWVVSPVGVQMELQALDWLKELFGLPKPWSGVMVTGATMANFVCVAVARHLARQVARAETLELMHEPQLNIVPFRYNPGGLDDEQLDELNQRLGEAVLADGRFLVGTSKLGPRIVFRPAFSNWRTRLADVEEFAAVVQELGSKLASGSPAG